MFAESCYSCMLQVEAHFAGPFVADIEAIWRDAREDIKHDIACTPLHVAQQECRRKVRTLSQPCFWFASCNMRHLTVGNTHPIGACLTSTTRTAGRSHVLAQWYSSLGGDEIVALPAHLQHGPSLLRQRDRQTDTAVAVCSGLIRSCWRTWCLATSRTTGSRTRRLWWRGTCSPARCRSAPATWRRCSGGSRCRPLSPLMCTALLSQIDAVASTAVLTCGVQRCVALVLMRLLLLLPCPALCVALGNVLSAAKGPARGMRHEALAQALQRPVRDINSAAATSCRGFTSLL